MLRAPLSSLLQLGYAGAISAAQQANMMSAQQANMVPAQQASAAPTQLNIAQSQLPLSRTGTPPLPAALSNPGVRGSLPQPLAGRPQGPLTVVGGAQGLADPSKLLLLQQIFAASSAKNPAHAIASKLQMQILAARQAGGGTAPQQGVGTGMPPPMAMGPPPPSRRDPKK